MVEWNNGVIFFTIIERVGGGELEGGKHVAHGTFQKWRGGGGGGRCACRPLPPNQPYRQTEPIGRKWPWSSMYESLTTNFENPRPPSPVKSGNGCS